MATKQAQQPKPTTKKEPERLQQIRLAELEERIVTTLGEQGVNEPNRDQIAKIGTPVVDKGALMFYTAEKYGSKSNHRWVSQAVFNRITQALKPEPKPESKS